MRTIPIAVSALVVTAATFGAVAPAAAATSTFGNGCMASTLVGGNITVVIAANAPGSPVPAAAPADGVLTMVSFQLPAAAATPIPSVVKVMRTAGVNQFTVVAQSPALGVTGTTSSFGVRMPVKAGDLLGLSSTAGTLLCSSSPGDSVAVAAGDQPPGSTTTYSPSSGVSVPVVATVEPDADGDGFGDATQDQCPQMAVFQTTCPVVTPRAVAMVAGRGVNVVVTTNGQGTVSVSGTTKVDRKKVKLTTKPQVVHPGDLAIFKVKLPKVLRSALAGLPPRGRIKVLFTVSATDTLGRVVDTKTKLTLHGTGH